MRVTDIREQLFAMISVVDVPRDDYVTASSIDKLHSLSLVLMSMLYTMRTSFCGAESTDPSVSSSQCLSSDLSVDSSDSPVSDTISSDSSSSLTQKDLDLEVREIEDPLEQIAERVRRVGKLLSLGITPTYEAESKSKRKTKNSSLKDDDLYRHKVVPKTSSKALPKYDKPDSPPEYGVSDWAATPIKYRAVHKPLTSYSAASIRKYPVRHKDSARYTLAEYDTEYLEAINTKPSSLARMTKLPNIAWVIAKIQYKMGKLHMSVDDLYQHICSNIGYDMGVQHIVEVLSYLEMGYRFSDNIQYINIDLVYSVGLEVLDLLSISSVSKATLL